jgi:hypothetical protein
MAKISRSKNRHTFQANGTRERLEKETDPEKIKAMVAHLEWWDQMRMDDIVTEADPKWQANNMEYDLRTCDWILEKVRASDTYAQNLYAAMCNMRFMKLDVIPILKEDYWSASWRHAGGIVSDMREEGDYIDWYCSGIGDGLGNGDEDGTKGYVPEGQVTEEIRADLRILGWVPSEWPDD